MDMFLHTRLFKKLNFIHTDHSSHVETVVLLERIFIEKHILKGKIIGEYE